MERRPFAVFDIDGTLIRWQLFHAIVHHLGKQGHLSAAIHERINHARFAWKKRGTVNGFQQYEKVLVAEYLAAVQSISPDAYDRVVQEVFDEYKDQTFTFTRDLLHDLKSKGYCLLAISGSHDEIIQKLAAYHGFDGAQGATFEQINGRFSGQLETPIFDKAAALQSFVTRLNLRTQDSYAVGDSTSDTAMLEAVEHPIAFNPDQAFFAVAAAQGWDIVVERKNMVYRLKSEQGSYRLASR